MSRGLGASLHLWRQSIGNRGRHDSALEARKVLVEEMGATLNTVAKDVKLPL